MPPALHQIRLYEYSARGLCTEAHTTSTDPYVFARRALKLSELGGGDDPYTRAEVYESYIDGMGWVGWQLIKTIRLSSNQRRKWRSRGVVLRRMEIR
jgi:hypothetical protein